MHEQIDLAVVHDQHKAMVVVRLLAPERGKEPSIGRSSSYQAMMRHEVGSLEAWLNLRVALTYDVTQTLALARCDEQQPMST